jgi:hypothetical protein
MKFKILTKLFAFHFHLFLVSLLGVGIDEKLVLFFDAVKIL